MSSCAIKENKDFIQWQTKSVGIVNIIKGRF
jgi:hypothetical protein